MSKLIRRRRKHRVSTWEMFCLFSSVNSWTCTKWLSRFKCLWIWIIFGGVWHLSMGIAISKLNCVTIWWSLYNYPITCDWVITKLYELPKQLVCPMQPDFPWGSSAVEVRYNQKQVIFQYITCANWPWYGWLFHAFHSSQAGSLVWTGCP